MIILFLLIILFYTQISYGFGSKPFDCKVLYDFYKTVWHFLSFQENIFETSNIKQGVPLNRVLYILFI